MAEHVVERLRTELLLGGIAQIGRHERDVVHTDLGRDAARLRDVRLRPVEPDEAAAGRVERQREQVRSVAAAELEPAAPVEARPRAAMQPRRAQQVLGREPGDGLPFVCDALVVVGAQSRTSKNNASFWRVLPTTTNAISGTSTDW